MKTLFEKPKNVNELGFEETTSECGCTNTTLCADHKHMSIMDMLHNILTAFVTPHEYVLPIPVPAVSGIVRGGSGIIAGFSIAETSGVASQPVTIIIRDGLDANAPVILAPQIAYKGSETEWFLPVGISFEQGLYVQITGVATGAILVKNKE